MYKRFWLGLSGALTLMAVAVVALLEYALAYAVQVLSNGGGQRYARNVRPATLGLTRAQVVAFQQHRRRRGSHGGQTHWA